MKAFNYSAYQVEEEGTPKGWAVISINEEAGAYYPILNEREIPSDKLLRLRFSDVKDKTFYDGCFLNPISREQAHEIVDFVERNKEDNFAVHCAAGISRSGAICLFLNLAYGHELRPHYWSISHPNPTVLGRLMIDKAMRVEKKIIID